MTHCFQTFENRMTEGNTVPCEANAAALFTGSHKEPPGPGSPLSPALQAAKALYPCQLQGSKAPGEMPEGRDANRKPGVGLPL